MNDQKEAAKQVEGKQVAGKQVAEKQVAGPARGMLFWVHVGVLALLGTYFLALLVWFGRLFLTGGTEEHVVMSIVIPVVLLVGTVSLVTFTVIVLDGARAEADDEAEPTAAEPDEA